MTSTSNMPHRQPFEEKALEYFAEVIINKTLIHEAGFGARAIPTYVGEWILSRYIEDGGLSGQSRANVAQFIAKYLPEKGQKDAVKDALLRQETVQLLDDYSVSVNLKTGQRQLRIPFLDMNDAFIDGYIVDQYTLLLTSGVWGVGELYYVPPDGDERKKGEVWMRNFRPFQVGALDIDYYVECRQYFTLDEWRDLLISSMGFNPSIYSERQKMLLVTRMLPFIESRVNLVELAPKGTGKSFVYDNLSRYARVVSGGKVSPAVLFHNLTSNTSGLITRYDVVVFDEVQSITGDSTGELVAGLKVYLESGKFSRGKTEATAEACFVMLGNIMLDADRKPLYIEESISRGTGWVVFEPNDETLWSRIRLNVGEFMHNLFRRGGDRHQPGGASLKRSPTFYKRPRLLTAFMGLFPVGSYHAYQKILLPEAWASKAISSPKYYIACEQRFAMLIM